VVVRQHIHEKKDEGERDHRDGLKVEQKKKSQNKKTEPFFHEKNQSVPSDVMKTAVPVEIAHLLCRQLEKKKACSFITW
jgi:hypothetical protein